MAGKNRYQMAKELIIKLKKKYSQLSTETLKFQISMHLGSDEKRCVIPYLKLMHETGLIKDSEGGWILLPNENSS